MDRPEQPRKITQIVAIQGPNESYSDAGVIALADDGTAWMAWHQRKAGFTEWEQIPPLPPID